MWRRLAMVIAAIGGLLVASTPALPASGESAPNPVQDTPAGQVVYTLPAFVPAWFDPTENPQLTSLYQIQYALHDALVKPMPGERFALSLAESYEIDPTHQAATFRLRPGIRFHNGDPVTAEDVRFTFETYRGANAKYLKDRTARIETPDSRTVRFVFNRPFPDFLAVYGSLASGAGWIVPSGYYQQVGPDGFKQRPIGAGPYKFVSMRSGTVLELEANTDYWRKVPHVQTLIFRGVTDAATRAAMVQTGEADLAVALAPPVSRVVERDPRLQLAPTLGTTFWIEFPGYEDPANPFSDWRVRQAVRLAIDRVALNDRETDGWGIPAGNWISSDVLDAVDYLPTDQDLETARALLAEAGYPDGFAVEELVPLPPYFELGQQVVDQLAAVGIHTRVTRMDRAAFLTRLSEGPGAFRGLLLNGGSSPVDAVAWIRMHATCQGSVSRTCVPDIEQAIAQADQASDPVLRTEAAAQAQWALLDNAIFVPLIRVPSLVAIGPRIAQPWQEIVGAIPQYSFVAPYEDIRLGE